MGCLPNPGGMFDQHPSDVAKMQKVLEARAQYQDDLLKQKQRESEFRSQSGS